MQPLTGKGGSEAMRKLWLAAVIAGLLAVWSASASAVSLYDNGLGDAYHMAAPAPDGEGAARCMQMAIDDAGIKPSEVQYINAHGTSTDLNDKYETQAIKTVFGDHAYNMAVSSTKSMTGHLLGAAGGVEAAYTVLTIYNQLMPPTINYEFPDPDCDLDYVPNTARKAQIEVALSNSFGFGGTNGTLVFRRWTETR